MSSTGELRIDRVYGRDRTASCLRFAGDREALGPLVPAPSLGRGVNTQAVVAVIGKVIDSFSDRSPPFGSDFVEKLKRLTPEQVKTVADYAERLLAEQRAQRARLGVA